MKLFEILNGYIGESCVRSYAWAADEEAARGMFLVSHPTHHIEVIRELFDADSKPFVGSDIPVSEFLTDYR